MCFLVPGPPALTAARDTGIPHSSARGRWARGEGSRGRNHSGEKSRIYAFLTISYLDERFDSDVCLFVVVILSFITTNVFTSNIMLQAFFACTSLLSFEFYCIEVYLFTVFKHSIDYMYVLASPDIVTVGMSLQTSCFVHFRNSHITDSTGGACSPLPHYLPFHCL